MKSEFEKDVRKVMEQFSDIQNDGRGGFKIRPTFSWLPIVIQVVTLIGVMGFAYGALDGRLRLIEYRLQQIELKVNRATLGGLVSGLPAHASEGP